jgi:hypothetical protein
MWPATALQPLSMRVRTVDRIASWVAASLGSAERCTRHDVTARGSLVRTTSPVVVSSPVVRAWICAAQSWSRCSEEAWRHSSAEARQELASFSRSILAFGFLVLGFLVLGFLAVGVSAVGVSADTACGAACFGGSGGGANPDGAAA